MFNHDTLESTKSINKFRLMMYPAQFFINSFWTLTQISMTISCTLLHKYSLLKSGDKKNCHNQNYIHQNIQYKLTFIVDKSLCVFNLKMNLLLY